MRRWDRFIDWWTFQKVFVAVLVGAIGFDALSAVWGERRLVGGFFEEFVARTLHLGLPLTLLFGACYVGDRTYSRSNSKFLAWVIGIAFFLAAGVASFALIRQIPGVDWRFERIERLKEQYY